MESENLADVYYKELQVSERPGATLTRFFFELVKGTPKPGDYGFFGKQIKLFGREEVYYAIVDIYSSDGLSGDNYKGLLLYVLKKRLEKRHQKDLEQGVQNDLTDYIHKIRETIEIMNKEEENVESII